MTKYIFVDLDECLFHCRLLSCKRSTAEELIRAGEKLVEVNFDDESDLAEYYGSSLRPGADHLLKGLRGIPDSRLFVLTSSVSPYANANNEMHGLGFSSDEIFSRESMQAGALDAQRFGRHPVYLIDNLPRGENRMKINFLWPVATNRISYIKVPEYWGDVTYDVPFTAEIVDGIVGQITNDLGNSS